MKQNLVNSPKVHFIKISSRYIVCYGRSDMLLEVPVGVRIFLSRTLVDRSIIVALLFVTTLTPKYRA